MGRRVRFEVRSYSSAEVHGAPENGTREGSGEDRRMPQAGEGRAFHPRPGIPHLKGASATVETDDGWTTSLRELPPASEYRYGAPRVRAQNKCASNLR